jgi:alginate O-acetyltransferase complex protein AlgJ
MSKLNVSVERIADDSAPLPFKWWLDFPKNNVPLPESSAEVEIRGWVVCVEHLSILVRSNGRIKHFDLNRARPDVLRKLEISEQTEGQLMHCGFSHQILLDANELEIGVKVGEDEFWLSRVKISASKPVVLGRNNWLFLDNDTNRSVDQFKGECLLTEDVLAAWKNYLQVTKLKAVQEGIHWCLLIAPAKEELYQDYYPHTRGRVTPIDQFLNAVDEFDEVVFPIRELAAAREMCYYSVDTHWSDYGAYLGAVEVVRKLGLEAFREHLTMSYRVVLTFGDLGGKVLPRKNAPKLVADYSRIPIKKTFDNGILNTGKIWVYENGSAPLKESLVLFGDSFSLNLAKQLCNVFSRVVYAHTVATWDEEIVSAEQARFVVLQTNQRFLMTVPNTHIGVWDLAYSKVEKLDVQECESLTDALSKNETGGNSYYLERMENIVNVRRMIG